MQLKRVKINVDIARTLWGDLSPIAVRYLEDLIRRYFLSITSGDILFSRGKMVCHPFGTFGHSLPEALLRHSGPTRSWIL